MCIFLAVTKSRRKWSCLCHPKTNIAEENNRVVYCLIEDNHRLMVTEIASADGINYVNAQVIIIDDFGFQKVLARWVFDFSWMNRNQRLLIRYLTEENVFLYKKWAHHYNTERKQATMEWRNKGKIVPVSAKCGYQLAKYLCIRLPSRTWSHKLRILLRASG